MNVIDPPDDLAYPQTRGLEGLASGLDVDYPRLLKIALSSSGSGLKSTGVQFKTLKLL